MKKQDGPNVRSSMITVISKTFNMDNEIFDSIKYVKNIHKQKVAKQIIFTQKKETLA